MTFRDVIAKAMHEAADEYARILRARLLALLGPLDAPEPARAAGKPRRRRTATPDADRESGVAPRAGGSDALRERVVDALAREPGLGRAELLARLRLAPSDEARLGTALIRLRAEGRVRMEGTRRGATYHLSGAPRTRGA